MSKDWENRLKQDLALAPEKFSELIHTIAKLRHPRNGCPWDLKQTHESLRHFMLEEAYEAVEAMGGGDPNHLREELGDVLLQVLLNSQLLRDSGSEGIVEVISGLTQKMVRRHPHVFEVNEGDPKTISQVKQAWDEIKKKEKEHNVKDVKGFFSELKKQPFPALLMSYKIGKKSEKINFDWEHFEEVWQQFLSEVEELEEELKGKKDPNRVFDELGDVFFSLSQVCRHLNIDPEVAASAGNSKFLARFELMESIAYDEGLVMTNLATEDLEALWKKAKEIEKGC